MAKRFSHGRAGSRPKTIGFGCPTTVAPHRFLVIIPRANRNPVVITEDMGAQGEYADQPAEIDRVVLERTRWRAISKEVERIFNERLKSHGLAISRWKTGENRVDRLLGKELIVLAWAIEHTEARNISGAVRNWLALRPEERWWLYGKTVATTGGINDGHQGWRLALRDALAGSNNNAVITPVPKNQNKDNIRRKARVIVP